MRKIHLLIVGILFLFITVGVGTADTIPPTPFNLTNTIGNYWVNHTWEAGNGNVTDLFNVSVNGTWHNGTANTYYNNTVGPDGWSNISIYAYNTSGNGTLNLTNISQDIKAPSDTIDPVINSVTLNNSTPNTGEDILVTVDTTDDTAVTGVNAEGVALSNTVGNLWNGTITASEGTHVVNVSSKDAANNIAWDNSTSYTATTIDTTDPVINSVTLNNSTPNTGEDILVTVDTTDDTAVTGVNAEGVALSNTVGNLWNGTITASEGAHVVNVSSKDAANNIAWDNSTSYTATTIDTIDPVINTVTLNNSTPNTGEDILVTVDTTDDTAVTGVNAEGVTLSNTVGNLWQGTITASEGTNVVNVSSKDAANNIAWDNSTSYTATTIDTIDPVINTVTLNNSTPNTGEDILVTVDTTDDTAVTGVNAEGVTISNTVGNLWQGTITAIEGTHVVDVSSKDAANNIAWDNSTSYTATTIDTTDPVINSVTLNNSTPNTGEDILVTVDTTDDTAVTGVEADGFPLSNTVGNLWNGTITASEGAHVVNVSSKDAANNIAWDNSTSYTATTIDTIDPVINSVTLNNSTPNTGEDILVTVDTTDDTAVTGVNAEGVALSNTVGNLWNGTITASEGTHVVNVSSKDAANNIAWDNSTSYTATTIDTTDPVINSVTLNNSTPNTGEDILVTVDTTDDTAVTGVNAEGVALSNTVGNLWNGTITASEGAHVVNVSSKDAANNIAWDNSTSYTATTIDTIDPVINSVTLNNSTPNTGEDILVTVDTTDDTAVTGVNAEGVALSNTVGNLWNGTITASEGTHVVNVSSKDAANNIAWDNSTSYTATTIDTIDPVINSVTLNNSTPNTGEDILVTVDTTDDTAVTGVNAEGVALSNTVGNLWNGTITASEGTHVVNVSSKDAANNIAWDNSTSYTATTIDTIDPVINSVTLNNSTPNTGEDILVTVDTTDDTAVTGVNAEGVALSNTVGNLWNGTITASEGTHVVNVSSKDAANNIAWDNSTSYTATTIDTIDPVINSVTLNNSTPNTGEDILVTVDTTDDTAVTGVNAEGVALSNTVGNLWNGTITASEGTHVVNVSSKDAANNIAWDNSTSYTATTIDTTDPVINSVTLNNSTPNTGEDILVTVDTTDDTAVTGVNAEGVALSNTVGNLWNGTITASEGAHVVNVSSKDAANNIAWDNSTSYTATTIDTIDPVINSVTLNNSTPNTGEDILVTVDTTDDTAVTGVNAEGVALSNTVGNLWNGTITASEGTHVVNVSSKDAANNIAWDNSTSYTATTIDTIDPVINSVTLNNSTPNTGEDILVTVDTTDDTAVTGVEADGFPLSNTVGNLWQGTITAIEGTHVVNVSSKDAANNIAWDNSTSYIATTIDTIDPVINTVTLNNSTPNTGEDILVTVDTTDDTAVTEVHAEGVTISNTVGNLWQGTITAIEGTHVVNVSSKDAANNIAWDNSTSYTATTIGTTDPTAVAGSDQTVNEDTVVNFDGSDSSGDVVNYSWDFNVIGGITVDATGVTTTHTYSNPGTYTVTLNVSDAAGNSDTDTLTVTVKAVTTSSSSSGGSSSSSSSGNSGEAFKNIVCTETDRRFISKDQKVSFNFELECNYVKYINFTGLSSFGKEAAKVEILNHTSSLVSIDAPDVVFKNLNVWIGSMGLITENKVLDPTISFNVDKSWVKDNGITLNTIYLFSYDDSLKNWEKMSTQKIGEDSSSYYFKADLPLRKNIGPMAISGRTSLMPVSSPTPTPSVVPNQTEPNSTPEITPIATPITWTSSWNEKIPGFQASIAILMIIVLYIAGRKRD